MPTPSPRPDEILVRILELGIDGTDLEISRGEYGELPENESYLILGHEALGEVDASASPGFSKGELVTLLVRRPDGCINCQNGQMDMCIEGHYRECGIKGAHGYFREYVAASPNFLVKVPAELRPVAVLTEPASIAVKGIEQAVDFHERVANPIRKALVLGAGPLGLLATSIIKLHGFDTYVLDIVPKSSLKARLVEELDVNYLDGHSFPIALLRKEIGNLDLIVEATGNSTVAFKAMCDALGTNGVFCLLGISTGEKPLTIDAGLLNMQLVLGNKVVFGSVNSNRRHFEKALLSLGQIEKEWPGWLSQLMTRRLTINDFKKALEHEPGSIKTVIEISQPTKEPEHEQ
jgi:threonine dehydrogenase-like Zn-dependent dehydrogenase